MTGMVNYAINILDSKLKNFPWYVSTGSDETSDGTVIVIRVSHTTHPELREVGDTWMGYPVVIKTV